MNNFDEPESLNEPWAINDEIYMESQTVRDSTGCYLFNLPCDYEDGSPTPVSRRVIDCVNTLAGVEDLEQYNKDAKLGAMLRSLADGPANFCNKLVTQRRGMKGTIEWWGWNEKQNSCPGFVTPEEAIVFMKEAMDG